MSGFVYILTNPTMPDLVKIGSTTNLDERLRNLSSHSGVPVPFECYYCCEVEDHIETEQRLHFGLGDTRINSKREFFRIDPERVKVLLEGYSICEVTPEDFVETEEEKDALNREKARRPAFSFSMVDIEIGARLRFWEDEKIIAKVVGEKKIEIIAGVEDDFANERLSLSQAAMLILNEIFDRGLTSVRGPDYWLFEGETLTERRIRLEGNPDDD